MNKNTHKNSITPHGFAIAIGLAALLGCPPGIADQNYYRWVDDQGETILSDRPPPPGVEYEIVNTKSNITRTTDGGGSEGGDGKDYITAESQKDPEMCQRAKDNLEALTQSDQITMRDDSGELRMLTEEEIATNIETTRGHIVIFCGTSDE